MVDNKKLKDIDTKASKLKRMCTLLVEKDEEWQSPTKVAHEVGVHHDTIRDIADELDTMNEAGIKTLRDKNGKLLKIRSSSETLEIRSELRDIRKEMIGLKDIIDKLIVSIKKKK